MSGKYKKDVPKTYIITTSQIENESLTNNDFSFPFSICGFFPIKENGKFTISRVTLEKQT